MFTYLNLHISLKEQRSSHFEYPINKQAHRGQPVSLDINHTHYILIDEGIRNSFARSCVAQFRNELEQRISTPIHSMFTHHLLDYALEDGCGVPVVRVIVEGGYDILVQAEKSTELGIPVVICAGTGRVADVIAKAMQYNANSKK